MNSKFRGVFTALVTPFRDGKVDDQALIRLVHQQIEAGVHGLVPCGTTGESPTLSHAEHLHVIKTVVDAAAGRVPVLAGSGSNSTLEAIDLARGSKERGAQGTLQIVPYYNKPNQSGLLRHFTQIADAVDLPVILYNVPSRTVTDLLPETVAELAKHPKIRGIKEATADMHRAAQIREQCGEDFDLLSGDDFTAFSLLGLGGHGIISVISNVIPKIMAEMVNLAHARRWDEARALHYRQLPLCRALFEQSNPIPIKAAMAMLGYCEPELRSPLDPLDPQSPAGKQLSNELKQLGVL